MSGYGKPLPVLSLPNSVLYPGADLPIKVFDPAHKLMLIDVIKGDKTLVVVLVHNPWEERGANAPALHSLGTVAVVSGHEPQKDGSVNISLHGIGRATVRQDIRLKPYRVAMTDAIAEEDESEQQPRIDELRKQIMKMLYQSSWQQELGPFPSSMLKRVEDSKAANFVPLVCGLLKLNAEEQQGLLERDGQLSRLQGLMALFERQLLQAAHLGEGPSSSDEDGEFSH